MSDGKWRFALAALGLALNQGAGAVEESEVLKQVARVIPPYLGDAAPADQMGRALDLSGDLMIVAVPEDDDIQSGNAQQAMDIDSGSAVIYQRDMADPGQWIRVAKLLPDGISQAFGFDVAIDGDVAAVGARTSGTSVSNGGAVYLYERNAGGPDNWGQVATIVPSGLASGDNFGWSVDVSGDLLLVGAPDDDEVASAAGAAYLFARDQGGTDAWGEVTKLLPDAARAATGAYDFGAAVAINGDTVAVGAGGDDNAASNAGAVYVFDRNQGGADAWGRTAVVDAGAGAQSSAGMGNAVAIEGDWLVAGARSRDTAYLFGRNTGDWAFVKELPNDFQGSETTYGDSVAISGDLIAVGDSLSPPDRNGAVALYRRDEGGMDNWGFLRDVFASDPLRGLDFGVDVALDGDILAGGAPGDDQHSSNGGVSGSGAVFVFERSSGGSDNFGETAKLTLGESGAEAYFGNTVAVHGNYAVVGAPEAREFGAGSGGAYILRRDGGDWAYLTTLQPSGVDDRDVFGYMVDIWGDHAVVLLSGNAFPKRAFVFEKDLGGPDNWGQRAVLEAETSNGSGYVVIQGDTVAYGEWGAQNSLGDNTGAVRIFQRDAGGADNWGFVTKVGPTDVTAAIQFGWSVDIDGDRMAVGARLDDDGGNDVGAVYVFDRNTGGADQWGQLDKLVPSTTETRQQAGSAVAISGDTVAAGAPQLTSAIGGVYLFEAMTPTDWQEQLLIDSPEPRPSGTFGSFVELSGDRLVVADPGYRDLDLSQSTPVGAARVFDRNEGGSDAWGQRKLLQAADRLPGDGLTAVLNSAYTNRGSLGFDGKTIIAGAHDVDTLNLDVGAVYLFFTDLLLSDSFEEQP
ncbi:MAG: FG-GAP repeat protein [Xanthomonadales bacterium]|nr:FG-GAP repeat protein [Xanthomonadales bacterium]